MFKGKDVRSDNNAMINNSRSTLQENISTIVSSNSVHNQRKSLKSRSRLSCTKPNVSVSKSKSKLHKQE